MKKQTISFNAFGPDPLSDKPLIVNESQFWGYYISILELCNGIFLNEKEKEILVYLLSNNPTKSHFKAPLNKIMQEKLNIGYHNLHRLKYSLEEKGVITKTHIPGDYMLIDKLIKYQRKILELLKSGLNIEYRLKFKLNETRDKEISEEVPSRKAEAT